MLSKTNNYIAIIIIMDNQTSFVTKQPNVNKKSTRLSFADGLRGIAALWVVFFHLSEGHHIDAVRQQIPTILTKLLFDWGHLGVAIFFVLSGFVMALTAHNAHFNAKNALRFVTRRLTRLAPPYYFAITFTLLLMLVKSKALHVPFNLPSSESMLQHLFFMQGIFNTPHINVIFWTLCIEVQFYIAFALLLWLADYLEQDKKLNYARNKIIISIFCLSLLWPLDIITNTIWSGGFIGFWYSFLLGVIVCWAWLNKGLSRNELLVIGFCLCLAVLIIGIVKQNDFALVAAMTAGLILLAGVTEKMHIWLNWPWLQWLGLVSYSLYLLHNPITGASFNIAEKLVGKGFGAEILASAFTLIICLVAAYLSFLIIERPSIRWSHHFKIKK